MRIPKAASQSMTVENIQKLSETANFENKNEENLSFATDNLKFEISDDDILQPEKNEMTESSNMFCGEEVLNSPSAAAHKCEQELDQNLLQNIKLEAKSSDHVFCAPIKTENKQSSKLVYLIVPLAIAGILGVVYLIKKKS